MEALVDAEQRRTASHDGHRRLDRLLHHVAELPGMDQLTLARHDRGFDGEQLAADLGPCKARDLTDLIVLLRAAVAEAPHAEILREIVVRDAHDALARLQQKLLHDLAADVRNLALEIAHAR